MTLIRQIEPRSAPARPLAGPTCPLNERVAPSNLQGATLHSRGQPPLLLAVWVPLEEPITTTAAATTTAVRSHLHVAGLLVSIGSSTVRTRVAPRRRAPDNTLDVPVVDVRTVDPPNIPAASYCSPPAARLQPVRLHSPPALLPQAPSPLALPPPAELRVPAAWCALGSHRVLTGCWNARWVLKGGVGGVGARCPGVAGGLPLRRVLRGCTPWARVRWEATSPACAAGRRVASGANPPFEGASPEP